jgi:uncharacterized protein YndB with AHSA1/START domain
MKRINFKTDINAPAEKVWQVLWNDRSYREWASTFSPGCYAESDWKEGSSIRFLSPEGEGMRSEIAKKVDNKLMSFRHLGTVAAGKDVADEKEKGEWKGAMENYHLRPAGQATELEVEIDVTEEFEDYFKKTFPRALQRVKDLSEQKN